MSMVHYAAAQMKELRADASLPAKFLRLLGDLPLKTMFDGKSVAIKVHLGGNLGYTTIPPLFMKLLVDKVKEAGGEPFITDGSDAVGGAKNRGYTEEVIGAPIVPAAGVNGDYFEEAPVNYLSLKNVQVCGAIAAADAMIVFSHGKGHGHCGWGGAIKNVAMGCVTGKSRGDIHGLIDTEFEWNSELCTHCNLCLDNCPSGAISFKNEKLKIFLHHCRYCMHCVEACPHDAIKINEEGIRQFQAGMARATKACLDTFEPNRLLYINHVLSVTPFCDCWGFSSPAIVPDVGIFAGTDMVAVEQASIDSVKTENFIPGSLPPPLIVRDIPGHLFQRIHGKDPYLQCEESAKMGLGMQDYEIKEID